MKDKQKSELPYTTERTERLPVSQSHELFARRGGAMRVFFLGAVGSKAIAYWRSLVPAKFLARARLANTAIMFGNFTKEAIDWADIVVFQRVAGGSLCSLAEYCRMTGTGMLFDLDDDVFNYPDSPEYHEVDTDKVAADIMEMVQLSDAVSVTEETLAASLREKTDKPIYIIPNSIDFDFWDAPRQKNYTHDDFLIGWMGGAYHLADFDIIVPVMRYILKKYDYIKYCSIGAVPEELIKEFPDKVLFHKFTSIDALPDLMSKLKFNIGLAPLWENKFNDSRSNIRLLQYSVLEIPTVASAFGAYKRAVDDNFPMIAVPNKTEEWIAAIEDLIENKEQREFLGKAARERTKYFYRAERSAPKWAAALREVKFLAER